MSIYKGNQKQGTIYKGSTKIGKVYKGSSLVYQSEPSLPLYGCYRTISGNNYYAYLIGLYSTSGAFSYFPFIMTLTTMTGTLGASGSKITRLDTPGSSTGSITLEQPYYKTITLNNLKVYVYGLGGSSGLTTYILEKSTLGSYVIYNPYQDRSKLYPSSVTSTKIVYEGTNFTRDSTRDAVWRPSGVS